MSQMNYNQLVNYNLFYFAGVPLLEIKHYWPSPPPLTRTLTLTLSRLIAIPVDVNERRPELGKRVRPQEGEDPRRERGGPGCKADH
jgi:hypothetical protein